MCSRPMRTFLSCLHGRHQFPFPASKFRVLLAIWFVSFYNPNSLVSRENVWCSYEKASYRSHLFPDNHLPFLSWPHDPVRVLPVGLVTQMFVNIFISYCKYKSVRGYAMTNCSCYSFFAFFLEAAKSQT